MEWIKCSEKMPDPEKAVLLLCEIRPGGHKYICVGFYVPNHWLREQSDYSWDWEACSEYDEEHDDYFVNEGWYERIMNWDEYSAVGIGDFVIAWMPLPKSQEEQGDE